jgi:Leucine-rich repeat (LRR) protein
MSTITEPSFEDLEMKLNDNLRHESTILNLMNLGLTELPDLSNHTQVTYLDASGNNLTDVSSVVKLKQLCLDHNQLKILPDLSGFIDLKVLSVSYNELAEFPLLPAALGG